MLQEKFKQHNIEYSILQHQQFGNKIVCLYQLTYDYDPETVLGYVIGTQQRNNIGGISREEFIFNSNAFRLDLAFEKFFNLLKNY